MFLYLASAIFLGWLLFRLFEPGRRSVATQPSLDELRSLVDEQPSTENRLALADALEQSRQYLDAHELYSRILKVNRTERNALHGIARCELSLDKPSEAVKHLEELMDLDREFGDYSAALDYAEALYQAGRAPDAADLAEGLAKLTLRLNHRVASAHYLALAGKRTEAVEVLDEILSEPHAGSDKVKRWIKRAQRMRAELAAPEA